MSDHSSRFFSKKTLTTAFLLTAIAGIPVSGTGLNMTLQAELDEIELERNQKLVTTLSQEAARDPYEQYVYERALTEVESLEQSTPDKKLKGGLLFAGGYLYASTIVPFLLLSGFSTRKEKKNINAHPSNC